MPKEPTDFADSVLDMMRAQFGDAMKGYWFYEDPLCPCCRVQPIDLITYQGQKALSINGYMYRAKGILIAYALCSTCAGQVIKMRPGTPKSPQHAAIEETLATAYDRYLASLDG
jgi:hypothetical protein